VTKRSGFPGISRSRGPATRRSSWIAATPELAELTVLHIDKDFDLIAAFTGQPHERLDVR
jgi:predicted nucleic acid-binding protein